MSTLDPLDVARLHYLISACRNNNISSRFRARLAIVDFFTAHDAALRARIDELEAQLFIATAEPVFEAMGFGPMPAFPSIRGA